MLALDCWQGTRAAYPLHHRHCSRHCPPTSLPPCCSLLGFPIQFIGLVVTPYLALRYYVKGEASPLDDAEFLVSK